MNKLIAKINETKINFFLFFFLVILIFRAANLYVSLSYYTWFYEWNSVPIFLDLKNDNFNFLFEHGNRNQYQLFTKIFYIIFFKLFNNVWLPKVFTIFVQIIPALSLSLITTFLFYNNIKSKFVLISLVFAVLIPASLANYYHFSESHFYFQILLSILLFLIYDKYRLNNFLFLFFFFLLAFLSNLNMAAVTITTFLTFILFFILKSFMDFDKRKNIYLAVFFLISLIFFYYINLSLKVSSIYSTNDHAEFDLIRSIYLIFKALFHQNTFLLGFFIFIVIINKNTKENIKNLYSNNFFSLLLIYLFVIILSISFGKEKIYDRYRDFLQIGSILVIYIFNSTKFNELLKKITKFLITIVIIYNFLHFEKKVFIANTISKNYDNSISLAVEKLRTKQVNGVLKDDLHIKAKRFPYSINLSYENKIIKFKKYPN